MDTPVAFFIFNRPETTERVFEVIRKIKPTRLLLIADGPRPNQIKDIEKCKQVRQIIDQIDWECTVQRNYSDHNLGCGVRVSSGLDWVFQEVEEAIILEDDCLPDPTFFEFCTQLLSYYRNDTRVMCIAGDSYRQGCQQRSYGDASYYFSRYPFCWGWASWRRAWKYYDYKMTKWPQIRDSGWLHSVLDNQITVEYWTQLFEKQFNSGGTWDYQWTLACWSQNALTVVSEVNLISNIGFNTDATHTNTTSDSRNNMPLTAAILPIIHPPLFLRNSWADNRVISF